MCGTCATLGIRHVTPTNENESRHTCEGVMSQKWMACVEESVKRAPHSLQRALQFVKGVLVCQKSFAFGQKSPIFCPKSFTFSQSCVMKGHAREWVVLWRVEKPPIYDIVFRTRHRSPKSYFRPSMTQTSVCVCSCTISSCVVCVCSCTMSSCVVCVCSWRYRRQEIVTNTTISSTHTTDDDIVHEHTHTTDDDIVHEHTHTIVYDIVGATGGVERAKNWRWKLNTQKGFIYFRDEACNEPWHTHEWVTSHSRTRMGDFWYLYISGMRRAMSHGTLHEWGV